MKKLNLSIIIVNYKVKNELLACIESLINSNPKVSFEIIVVDNDERKTIGKELKRKHLNIKYIENPVNNGYGGGNNLGARNANGEFLFFLNPDTVLKPNAIDNLYKNINGQKDIGIVSPLLLNPKGDAYPLQGTKELTPVRAIFGLSFLNKLFPNNRIAKEYWMKNWDKNKDKEVDVIPGTAFMIRKDLFEKIGGFDENFFLYFEEFDLCRRIRGLGLKIKIVSSSRVIHLWESSTRKREDIEKIFSKSRFYYFKKNFGLLDAVIVSLITGLNKKIVVLILALLLGIFLRFYKLDQLMIFQGDQGWFYLSARDLILNHTIPLVGIPSSVVWLKQGPLGTYLIALALLFGKFNPVSPAIFFSILDVITIYLVFLLGKKWVNEETGLFASFLYATSPLILVMSRMPYHTSAIPFFVCLFFLLINNKNSLNLFLIFFVLGLLIQLELSNAVLVAVLFVYFLLKRSAFSKIKVIYSFIGLVIGISPFIIYDFSHKFIQTIGLPLWIINRTRLFLGLTTQGNATTSNFPSALSTIKVQLAQIVFPFSWILFYLILVLVIISLIAKYKDVLKTNLLLILLWLFIPLFGFLIHAAPGMAYFPLIFPVICLLLGFSFSYYLKINKILSVLLFIIIIFLNSFNTLKSDFFIWTDKVILMPPNNYGFGASYTYFDDVAEKIVVDSKGKTFNVRGGAFLGKYETGIDDFKYLILQKGGKILSNSSLNYSIYAKEDVGEGKAIHTDDKSFLYKNNYFDIFRDKFIK